MRIISDFRDYYDSVLAHGFDADRVFVRKSNLFSGARPGQKWPAGKTDLPAHLAALANWAGLCGRVEQLSGSARSNPDPKGRRFRSEPLTFTVGARGFKALWLQVIDPASSSADEIALRRYSSCVSSRHSGDSSLPPQTSILTPGIKVVFEGPVFDSASLEAWIPAWVGAARSKRGSSQRATFFDPYSKARHKGLAGQMEWLDFEPEPRELAALMSTAACPVAVANASYCAEENPRLAAFQFYRALDPGACMQEIAMFVSNLANPERPLIEIEDRYKIVEHGFDSLSFRKQPTKKAEPKRPKRPHPDRRLS